MLLRESSARTGESSDPRAITDSSVAPGLRRGKDLNALVEAAIGHDWHRLKRLSQACERTLGADAIRDTLVVAAGFNGITRVADATGIPLDPATASTTEQLRRDTGIDSFTYAEKSRRFD